jgi:hypothetical protein
MSIEIITHVGKETFKPPTFWLDGDHWVTIFDGVGFAISRHYATPTTAGELLDAVVARIPRGICRALNESDASLASRFWAEQTR